MHTHRPSNMYSCNQEKHVLPLANYKFAPVARLGSTVNWNLLSPGTVGTVSRGCVDPFLSRCVMLRLSRCPARWQISNFLQRCKVHGVSPACEASFTAGLTATLTHPTLWNAMIKGIAMARVPSASIFFLSHGHMIFDVKSHGFTWYINVQYIVMILRCHLDMSRLFPYLSWDVWSYGSSHSAPWFISQLSRVLVFT